MPHTPSPLSNEFGMMKLVNRKVFAYHVFNGGRSTIRQGGLDDDEYGRYYNYELNIFLTKCTSRFHHTSSPMTINCDEKRKSVFNIIK